jgi:hypothetical protein
MISLTQDHSPSSILKDGGSAILTPKMRNLAASGALPGLLRFGSDESMESLDNPKKR